MSGDRASRLCPNWLNSTNHKFGSHRDSLSKLDRFSASDRFSDSDCIAIHNSSEPHKGICSWRFSVSCCGPRNTRGDIAIAWQAHPGT